MKNKGGFPSYATHIIVTLISIYLKYYSEFKGAFPVTATTHKSYVSILFWKLKWRHLFLPTLRDLTFISVIYSYMMMKKYAIIFLTATSFYRNNNLSLKTRGGFHSFATLLSSNFNIYIFEVLLINHGCFSCHCYNIQIACKHSIFENQNDDCFFCHRYTTWLPYQLYINVRW